jgi:hypothetical protein
MNAQIGLDIKLYSCFNLWGGGQLHVQGALPLGKSPIIHCTEGWVDPDWTVVEIHASAGIRSLDCPAHSESLY